MLSENGAHDLARKILLAEDCPSWLYEISMGATTIWERWIRFYLMAVLILRI
uniref:Bac_rhamnosid n=1 Tax=uncultured Lactobacillus sp. TaxID=153152 RepID=A0A060CR31_9LACO|nr:Bac_rhamnosid [uncultured Lactobacillus sp.]